MCQVSQAIRTPVFSIFLNSLWYTEFLNNSNVLKYMSEGTGTLSSCMICIASSTSTYLWVRSRSRDVLLVAMLSGNLAMYSPMLQDFFFSRLLTTWSLLSLLDVKTRQTNVLLQHPNMRRCWGTNVTCGHERSGVVVLVAIQGFKFSQETRWFATCSSSRTCFLQRIDV
jgi:hypothetical protein